MDIGLGIVIGAVIAQIVHVIDSLIVRYYPDWALSKVQRNRRVINEATNKVRETHQSVSLHVDIDGNVIVDEE